MHDHSSTGVYLLGILAAFFAPVHPWAAAGAAFGCCFFLASPAWTTTSQRWLLGVFSWGIGYSAGVYWFGEGPPWSTKAMLISVTLSALAAVLFTAWFGIIASNGTLPPWLTSLFELIKFRKRGP
jgi:hypothetical protein